ncbi:Uncharacterised protein [Legionella waltersii]|nr:Uncharacterised protein [Legionella waltersii]
MTKIRVDRSGTDPGGVRPRFITSPFYSTSSRAVGKRADDDNLYVFIRKP